MDKGLAVVTEEETFLFVHKVIPENTEKYTFHAANHKLFIKFPPPPAFQKYVKDTKFSVIICSHMYIFVLGHNLSFKARSFRKLSPRKTVRISEQIVSADKYPCIFLCQMGLLFMYSMIKFCI